MEEFHCTINNTLKWNLFASQAAQCIIENNHMLLSKHLTRTARAYLVSRLYTQSDVWLGTVIWQRAKHHSLNTVFPHPDQLQ